ncbi:MAG TPA: hypothetical protein PLA71_00365 [Saccharofermentans sp.]|nr:hypothetical protein [Saccharofermentans sp.]
MKLEDAVREFISILETTEVSDSDREFHPTIITSCRCMDLQRISELIKIMKASIDQPK